MILAEVVSSSLYVYKSSLIDADLTPMNSQFEGRQRF